MAERDPSRPIGFETVVAIGASAGGLTPLREFLAALPPTPGAAFVVLQHLSPDSRSLTPELLQPHVAMPLGEARDGAPLRPNEVVFLPPGASLQVAGGRLRLEREDGARRSGTVIDTFLRTLAREFGPRSVGVLLSGGGWDGTHGLQAIKEAGGLTMVQDPESAEFESMPGSAIRAGVSDVVQPAARLADTLVHFLEGRDLPSDVERDGSMPRALALRLTKALKAHTGHDFSEYKEGTLTRRVARRCRLRRWATLDEYVTEVEESAEEGRKLVGDLLIGVTEFFRDPEAWEVLEEHVVPELSKGRGRTEAVRAWVMGCATGEEAYSLAMILHEHSADLAESPVPMVFATDIDEPAVEFAREGLYPKSAASGVSVARRARFFKEDDHRLRLVDHLREHCIFAEHNALRDPPFSQLDFLSCRNLMIYLQPSAQENLTEIFAFALKPGGFLFLGSAENVEDRRGLFESFDSRHRIYRRTEVPASLPTGVLGRPVIDRAAWGRTRPGSRREATEVRKDARRGVEQLLLRDFGPAALLVDHRREIIDYFGRTGKYIEPSQAKGGSSVVEMALPPLRSPLRAMIRAAEREGRQQVKRGIPLDPGDGTKLVDVTVRPVGESNEKSRFLIVFRERLGVAGGESREPAGGEDAATVSELEAELRDTQERLQGTIEQLETSNEELQSTNEELLSMNEEFQTSKEEALSANEELQLVNAELRTKVTQLDEAHADLENLFHSTQVATLFLDRERRIQRFTASMTDLFRLRETDVGRPIDEITRRFDEGGMDEAIETVLEKLEPAQMEVHVPDDDVWYSFRVSPYRTSEGTVEGVVLTFADITETKRNEARIREEQLYAQSIIETVVQPLVVLDSKLRVVSASRSFFQSFDYPPDRVLGTRLFELGDGAWAVPALEERLEGILPDGDAVEGVEMEFDLPGLGRRWMIVSARRLFTRETDRILLNLHDITDYWERVRVQEEEARRKDWFLAMLGHELRGPLAPIRFSIALLRQEELEPKKEERLLEVIDRQVAHLAHLVGDLLDLSRIAEGKLALERTPTDLVKVIRETAEDHRSRIDEDGLSMELALPEGPLWLEGDANRLKQAIGNLIDNARKYTPGGGRIDVLARRTSETSAEVVVEDTGAGMSPEVLAEAFEPFRQGPRGANHPEEGLGIGLTLARTVADAHGGVIHAESEGPGKGSRLTLRLPLTDRRTGGLGEGATTSSSALTEMSPRRIVVVEDQEFVAETTHQLLEAAGHDVTTVADGEGALDAIRKTRPEIVISDLGLPAGMSGHDLARAIRADPGIASTYLIALTGFGQDKDRKEAARAGFNAFLVKPASVEDLAKAIAEAPRRG